MMSQPTTSKETTGSAEETLVLMERMVTRLRARFINSVYEYRSLAPRRPVTSRTLS